MTGSSVDRMTGFRASDDRIRGTESRQATFLQQMKLTTTHDDEHVGLENEEPRDWVERECVEARDERANERELTKENAERQQKLLEQQQRVQEQELKILELKLRLQESTNRVQSMVADEQGESSMSSRRVTEVCSPHKLIPHFNQAEDDLTAYMQRFERVATCQAWPRESGLFRLAYA
ncbi:hypothetical protein HPB51_010374 [Rhipicephalus microplus]|uniref:Uncharacterized protein n=1 Tax=Rhipicephalus microplus TaxID=6941 RepID=A0A9J6EG37_RHIMP|nr:hypothetical protein HPB51_010374 [Rhipicephalus microplus]